MSKAVLEWVRLLLEENHQYFQSMPLEEGDKLFTHAQLLLDSYKH